VVSGQQSYFDISMSLIFSLLSKIVQFCALRPSITDSTFCLAALPVTRRSS